MKLHLKIAGLDDQLRGILNPHNHPVIHQGLDFFKDEKFTVDLNHKRFYINSFFPSYPGPAWERFFEGVYRIASGERVPIWTDFVTTGRCHCRCWHCFRAPFKDNSDLDIKVFKAALKDAYDLGGVMIGLTGGEPMLRNDIGEFVEAIPDGMEAKLYSTGHEINKSFIAKITGSNLTRAIISFDHYDQKKVTERRGNPHSFTEAINAIELLTDAGIYTAATLCVTEELYNPENIYRYLEFISNLKVDEIRIILPIPQGNLEGNNYKKLYVDAMKTLRQFKAETLRKTNYPTILLFCDLEAPTFLGCGAGSNVLSINNDGYVTPCVAVPVVFGNIYDQSLKQIFMNMGKYFKNSGLTCYGRRINRTIKELAINDETRPFSMELSERLAAKNIVKGKIGGFYQSINVTSREEIVNE